MSAFFPINPGGGAGGGQPQQGNAFVNATINGNGLVLVKGDGSSVRVDLSKIIPDVTNDLIKNITLNNNNLTLETANGAIHNINLKPILNASNVDYDNTTSGLQATTVQGAIDEIDGKANNAYIDASFNNVNGELTLIKQNGQDKVLNLSDLFGVREFSYDENTQKITVLDHNNASVEVDLNVFARLDKDNLFLGHNTFNELILLGKTPFVSTAKSEASTNGHSAGVYCGYRAISTHNNAQAPLQPQYVSAIKIKVINSYAVGDKVDNVYITEIKKVTNRTDDIVGETIVSDGSFIVEEDKDYGKCIYVPVQKTYTEDTYFIIGKKRTRALSECRYIYQSEISECVNNINIDNLPQKDLPLNCTNGNGWIVIHSLVTDDINVREELKRLDDYVPNTF